MVWMGSIPGVRHERGCERDAGGIPAAGGHVAPQVRQSVRAGKQSGQDLLGDACSWNTMILPSWPCPSLFPV